MSRRRFLEIGGLSVAISAVDPRLSRAVGAPEVAGGGRTGKRGKTLVYVFQRFGADGLNIVIPMEKGEHALYKSYRPNLAIDRSHRRIGPLTKDFGLHPLMAKGLYPLWHGGNMAVLPNVGYPEGSRSHFDSQLFLDNGTPHDKTTPGGWLNRYLRGTSDNGSPLRALAFGVQLPRSFQGPVPAGLNITSVDGLNISKYNTTRGNAMKDIARKIYDQETHQRPYDEELVASGRGIIAAMDSIAGELPKPTTSYSKDGFSQSMKQLAQLIRSDRFEIEVAEVDLPGWDTHAAQQVNSTAGKFPDLVSAFSNGIAAFVKDLGPERMEDVVILTTSEFGRTAHENGNMGTDHGSAWVSFVIGGGVKGGMHFGESGWSSLDDLREDRDVKHSVDFRDVFYETVKGHFGTVPPGLFPGWTPTPVGFLS